ncbi:unnamed protein product [Spodoptera littoralis]|uniref:Uncharacterized protein n=1 Tax=Spodoptera littoralis TaxID=7109 RepID=A0A9P0MVD3_SPOLI|nr:unnamed protein product [Spodoptera littoralis]CAH1634756.1 unnamed protein product [Spodoptera littoralis]
MVERWVFWVKYESWVKILEKENQAKDTKIENLEEKLEFFERKAQSVGIEIRNLPKKTGETMESLQNDIIQLGKTLNVNVEGNSIRDIYRTKSKDASNPVAVNFTTVFMKDSILKAVKNFNRDRVFGKDLHHERSIVRPCAIHDVYCIREFFTYNTQCSITEGPAPDPFIPHKIGLNTPHANLTFTLNNPRIKGLNNWKIKEFYINKASGILVMEVGFSSIVVDTPKCIVTYYRKGKESLHTSDFTNIEYNPGFQKALIDLESRVDISLVELFVTQGPMLFSKFFQNANRNLEAYPCESSSSHASNMAESVDHIYKALRLVPEFDGNSNVLTRFIKLCDQLQRNERAPEKKLQYQHQVSPRFSYGFKPPVQTAPPSAHPFTLSPPRPFNIPGPSRLFTPQTQQPLLRNQPPQYRGPSRTQQMFSAPPPNNGPQNVFRMPGPKPSGSNLPQPMSGVSHYVAKPFAPRPTHDWSRAAISGNDSTYMEAECPKVNSLYLCETKTRYERPDEPDCIQHLILHQELLPSCKLTTVKLRKEAVEQLDEKHYTINFPRPTKVKIVSNSNNHIKGFALEIIQLPTSNELPASREPPVILNSIALENLHSINKKIMLETPVELSNVTDMSLYHTTIPVYLILLGAGALIIALMYRQQRSQHSQKNQSLEGHNLAASRESAESQQSRKINPSEIIIDHSNISSSLPREISK